MSKKGTWIKKRDEHSYPSVKKLTDKGTMYISTPKEIDEVIKNVPEGRLITTKQIADKLAKLHKADYTCPMTTGIFVSIAANAAEEEKSKNKKIITPYWRVVKAKGRLYDKYLGKISMQKHYLEKEKFDVKATGKKMAKYEIANYKNFLVK